MKAFHNLKKLIFLCLMTAAVFCCQAAKIPAAEINALKKKVNAIEKSFWKIVFTRGDEAGRNKLMQDTFAISSSCSAIQLKTAPKYNVNLTEFSINIHNITQNRLNRFPLKKLVNRKKLVPPPAVAAPMPAKGQKVAAYENVLKKWSNERIAAYTKAYKFRKGLHSDFSETVTMFFNSLAGIYLNIYKAQLAK